MSVCFEPSTGAHFTPSEIWSPDTMPPSPVGSLTLLLPSAQPHSCPRAFARRLPSPFSSHGSLSLHLGTYSNIPWASLVAQMENNLPAMQKAQVRSLGREEPLENGMPTHSSILAWRIPWTEEPGELQSMGSQRVRHDWVTNSHTHTHTPSSARFPQTTITE